ncbi:hypothetical protein ScalyP_jg8544 [Parmales sp. scaly parma]|nr:hypothetical protein ScalyP_jg8544 [Parmales sp. scaly parma]
MAVTISFADKFTFSVTLQHSFFLVTSFLVYFLTRYYLTSFSYPIKSIHPTPPSVSTSKTPSSAPSIKNKDKSKIDCYSPSTNTYLGSVSVLPPSSVEPLAALASSAQSSWATTSFEERRQVLRTIQHYITSNTELICKVCCQDSGKTMLDALMGEVLTTCEKISWLNGSGEEALKKSYRKVNMMMLHKTAYVEYVPLGVLGVIAPWNYPFCNLMNHILSGLFSGNAVLVKVSEHTSWSAPFFMEIVKSALVAHNHSPDVVQLVTGFGDTGAAMVTAPSVDKIIFTGSPAVGRMVMAGAAPTLKPVVLELGGKDPMIFVDDVELDKVIPWAMRGCFQNCGQNCCGVERVFVYESVHSEFVSRVVKEVQALRQGATCFSDSDSINSIDCGAMVMKEQLAIVQSLVDDAVSQGAKILVGGSPNTSCGDGNFYQPTVLTGVKAGMRIWTEEVFGPVMCIIQVDGDSDDVCVRMVNDCPFGLGSSCYSGNQKRAESIGSRLRSGMFTANDFGVNYLIQSLPFGGVNESGFDRFAGEEGLRGCCLMRSVVVDRIPGVKTSIPPAFSYPVDGVRAMGFGDGLINMFYSNSVFGKLKAIWKIIKNA